MSGREARTRPRQTNCRLEGDPAGRLPSGAAGVLLEVVLRAFQLFGASANGS